MKNKSLKNTIKFTLNKTKPPLVRAVFFNLFVYDWKQKEKK